MPTRRSTHGELQLLKVRVVELEARVRDLERKLKRVERLAKVPRIQVTPAQRKNMRKCPGCFADVPPRARWKTCPSCGFEFSVVKPFPASRLEQ